MQTWKLYDRAGHFDRITHDACEAAQHPHAVLSTRETHPGWFLLPLVTTPA